MRRYFWSFLPLAIAGSFFLVAVMVLVTRAQGQTGGHYVYPLDDTYIHMAIAKNLALHGVWGTSKYHFGSLSSSPLWTLMLATLFKLIGIRELLPLVLCTLLAILILVVVDWIARREGLPPWVDLALLLAILLGDPLPAISMLGMEHILQTLVDLIFVYAAATTVRNQNRTPGHRVAWLFALAVVVCMTRFEGLFLVSAAAMALVVRKKWTPALAALIGGVLPVIGLGIFSVCHGGMWLPNSVLLKGHRPSFTSFEGAAAAVGGQAYETLAAAPWLLALVIFALALLILSKFVKTKDRDRFESAQAMLLMTIITTALHAQFANIGHLFRYDSYLIALLLVSVTLGLSNACPQTGDRRSVFRWMYRGISAAGIAIVFWLLAGRFCDAWVSVPVASTNIWGQQYQFAHFLKRYYDGRGVAVNDIGAAAFYSDIRSLDIYGLDDPEVGRLRYHNEVRPDTIADIAKQRDVKIAVVYTYWIVYFNQKPPPWQKVATWTIEHNTICAGDTVTFYAVDPAETDDLARHLKEYQAELPRTVTTSIR